MPWINLTLRRGALPKPVQHAVMAKLTEVLMWWEKVPNTPSARKMKKGWVYEVAEDADYNAGSPDHEKALLFRRDPHSDQPVGPAGETGVDPRFHPRRAGGRRFRQHTRQCAARLGDDQRTRGGGLGDRRPHRLAARLYERP